MKKTWVLSALVLAAMLPIGETTGFATVRGSIFLTPFGSPPRCGAEGTLYTNLTGGPINFDLSFGLGGCTATLSWTDADGQAQTFTLNPANRTIFATSLPPGGAISFSTSGTTTSSLLIWTLGTSGGVFGGGGGTCGTSGAAYANLTANPIFFDLAGVASGFPGKACAVILSWTDADGQAQRMTFSANTTQGFSTSLPSGGVISWTLEPGAGSGGFSFDVERTPLAAKHKKF